MSGNLLCGVIPETKTYEMSHEYGFDYGFYGYCLFEKNMLGLNWFHSCCVVITLDKKKTCNIQALKKE